MQASANRAALPALAIGLLLVQHAIGQESPPAPGPEADAAQAPAIAPAPAPEVAPAPATASLPAPESAGANATPSLLASPPGSPAQGARRIVILPVDFTVYHKQVSGLEAVPDWSTAAQGALSSAAFEQLSANPQFSVLRMPTTPDEAQPTLLEHVALLKVVVGSATNLMQMGGAAWAGKKTAFDYSIGDGLRSLADQWQADYALLVQGSQVTQSGGAAFTQFLAAAGGVAVPGGGTALSASIVDLRSGAVKWLNTSQGMQLFGMTQSDMRKPETASGAIAGLFKGFPTTTLVAFPPF